jgi:hypothetical protein
MLQLLQRAEQMAHIGDVEGLRAHVDSLDPVDLGLPQGFELNSTSMDIWTTAIML